MLVQRCGAFCCTLYLLSSRLQHASSAAKIVACGVAILRGLAISAIAIVLFIAAALLFLHTNPVQSRVLGWSIGELERRFDLDLSADDLHYNLVLRRVTLTNVRLAAVGHRDNPFFTREW